VAAEVGGIQGCDYSPTVLAFGSRIWCILIHEGEVFVNWMITVGRHGVHCTVDNVQTTKTTKTDCR
jgi:hypothetical protein